MSANATARVLYKLTRTQTHPLSTQSKPLWDTNHRCHWLRAAESVKVCVCLCSTVRSKPANKSPKKKNTRGMWVTDPRQEPKQPEMLWAARGKKKQQVSERQKVEGERETCEEVKCNRGFIVCGSLGRERRQRRRGEREETKQESLLSKQAAGIMKLMLLRRQTEQEIKQLWREIKRRPARRSTLHAQVNTEVSHFSRRGIR